MFSELCFILESGWKDLYLEYPGVDAILFICVF